MATRLARSLADSGEQVRALYRSKSNKQLQHKNIELIQGDLTDSARLAEFVSGCDKIYHVAAHASNWAKDPEIFYRVNVDATIKLIHAGFNDSVKRIVFTSSAGVIGPTTMGGPVTETTKRQVRYFGDYEHSKAIAEDEIRKIVKEYDWEVIIVNPTRIYGPGAKGRLGSAVTNIIDKYMQGKWKFRLGTGNERANYAYIDDVVQGHILAMKNGQPGERYILGGENVSFNEFINLIAKTTGVTRRLIAMPYNVMGVYTRTEDFAAKWFGIPPKITHNWTEKLKHEWTASVAKAQEEIGYTYIPLNEGIIRTVNWLRNETN